MTDGAGTEDTKIRTASCTCGGLRVRVVGQPIVTYTCSCEACQRTTGSAFAYRAQYPTANIFDIEGEQRRWRRTGDAGRWVEYVFCPVCGALVFMEAEGLRDAIAVSVGCFADRSFDAPTRMHWTTTGHKWVLPPPDAQVVS